MQNVLVEFFAAARGAGIRASVAETIDALRAAAVVGVEREPLREALAATLVKDEIDRATFDEVFDRFFSSRGPARKPTPQRSGGDAVRLVGRPSPSGEGSGRTPEKPPEAPRPPRPVPSPREREREERRAIARKVEDARRDVQKRRRRRALLRRPFREMDPLEGEELVELAATLSRHFRARLRRRLGPGRRGRLDFRRTFRRSIPHGGVALELAFRRRRPDRPSLVVLCDVSGSVRHASEFFASVIAPCRDFFRRVDVFVYVDHAVEAEIEGGRLVPVEPFDAHAWSDFGRVLASLPKRFTDLLGRNTLLLVLGDARNNRRPPRADLLAPLARSARALFWLNSERRELWNTGDSVMEAYSPACNGVLECANGEELLMAVSRLFR